MLQNSPPVQLPTLATLDKLQNFMRQRPGDSGPVFIFDALQRVFLVALVDHGLLVHWQLECCRDQAEADSLVARYKSLAIEAVALAQTNAPVGRPQLQ